MKWIENVHVYDCEVCGGKAVYNSKRINSPRKCEECRYKKIVISKKELPQKEEKPKCIFCHNPIYTQLKEYCSNMCETNFKKLSLPEQLKAKNQCKAIAS